MDNSWAHPVEKVLRDFDVSIEQGLSDEEAVLRQQKYGKNCLTSKDATPFWKLVLEQFEDPLVRILLTAAIISFILAIFEDGEEQLTAFFEPLVIFLILIANAIVGVLQETNAEKAIEALKQFEPETAVVTRSGEEKTINAEDLVPGDIVTVAVGKTVPADIRVVKIQTITFRIDQKLLTGESDPVNKIIDAIPDPDSLQGKRNTMFKGTNCTTGQAKGVVVGIGQNTEIGKIKETIENTEEVQSPLQQKLEEFSELLTKVIGVICIAVWAINIRQFSAPEHGGLVRGAVYYFKIAVALAVAAIPEGLPAVVTTCLALGTVKMAKKNAIVRHLPSVETLGCTSVICSDKTGTLTTSKMSVCHAVVVGSVSSGSGVQLLEFNVDGTTYDPIGSITDLHRDSLVDGFASYPALRESAIVCSLCNNSRLNYDPLSKKVDTMGEPTELALRVFSEKINNGGKPVNDYSILSSQLDADFEKLATLEFSRDRKSMSVLVRHKGSHLLLVKGAPESLLERCNRVLLNETGKPVPLTNEIKEQLTKSLTDMSHRALRVLGFAIVPEARGVDEYDFSPEKYGQYENDMVFVGMAGMLDPPRPEVKAALATCRKAGIDVIVITGDNKNTAEAICRKIGLFSPDEDLSRRSLTGRDWDALDEAQKVEMLKTVRLFSRTEPVHKSDIVQILQRQKNVVAMTGDGVNDAPALKIANIGIGMGSGTDVAKAASDMILADDNFATIVSAVEEGRAIYSNTKQFIRYLISSNIGEVACIFITAALGIPEALIPVQLLWVNLVTDGLPATALGFNPPDLDIMEKPPRSSSERIINGWMFFRYMVIGVYVGIATVGGFLYWYTSYENGPLLSLELLKLHDKCVGELRPGLSCSDFVAMNRVPSTIALSVLVTIEMFNAINSLSESQSLIRMPPWRNWWLIGAVLLSFSLHFVIVYVPFFASVFQVAPISLEEWYIVLAFSFPVVIIDEVFKLFSRLLAKHHA